MFVALEAGDYGSSGIFGGVLNILTRPKAQLEAREALGAAYGVIVAAQPVRAADWRSIAVLAGRYGDKMLLPDGLDAPLPLKKAVFPRFERRLMLDTAIEIVKRTRMPMYKRVVGLVDLDGKYADFLYPLLHHYTSVKVLTGQTGLYGQQADSLMEALGAPVLICDDYTAFSDCVLIIAPDGIGYTGKLACPVLAFKPPKIPQESDFITDLQVVPHVGLASLCPAGIPPHKFAAALYEYCGVESISCVASRMMFRYSASDLAGIVREVMRASGSLSIF